MYAIFKTGGKQYRVEKGDVLNVEKITLARANAKTVKFDEVLMLGGDGEEKIGTPYVEGAQVEAKVLENGKSEKIIVYKYKAKKDYRRKQGHRQPFTRLEITKVGMKAASKPRKAKTEADAPKKKTAESEE